MVLLKNDRRFSAVETRIRTIEVVGPNATVFAALEGNYNAVPSHPVLPLDGIRDEFRNAKSSVRTGFALCGRIAGPGAANNIASCLAASTEEGVKAEYFASSELNGQPMLTRVDPQIDFDWNSASPAAGLSANDFGVRWSGTITRSNDRRLHLRHLAGTLLSLRGSRELQGLSR